MAASKECRGLDRRDLPSGARYLKLHHYADPEKDADWLIAVRREMSDTPSHFRLQILMDDVHNAGALWSRELLDAPGFRRRPVGKKNDVGLIELPLDIVRTVCAIDPSITDPDLPKNRDKKPDECGIIVAGLTRENIGVVLADFSGVYPPEKWSRIGMEAARVFGCGSLVYEANQGGALVRDTLRTHGVGMPLVEVHASLGKRARAEPVAALYHQERFQHAGEFVLLEAQMCSWNAQDPSQRSPNRIDALVWAAHGLGLCSVTGGRVHERMKRRD